MGPLPYTSRGHSLYRHSPHSKGECETQAGVPGPECRGTGEGGGRSYTSSEQRTSGSPEAWGGARAVCRGGSHLDATSGGRGTLQCVQT